MHVAAESRIREDIQDYCFEIQWFDRHLGKMLDMLEEAGELVQYDLDSNSFLNHAAKNLPSTMLGWHYRSRSESLISFSNWTFYDGRLLTVPEENLARGDQVALDEVEMSDEVTSRALGHRRQLRWLEHGGHAEEAQERPAHQPPHPRREPSW